MPRVKFNNNLCKYILISGRKILFIVTRHSISIHSHLMDIRIVYIYNNTPSAHT